MTMKRLVKSIINATAAVVVFFPALCCRIAIRSIGPHEGFSGWSQFFALFPGRTGVYLRRAFYRQTMTHCDQGACITFGTIFSHPTARIGKDVYIGARCTIGDVTLEDDVLIASNVSIMNGSRQHGIERWDIPIREQPGVMEDVTIGANSWIGEGAIVGANVGQHCIIGAGAVVTKAIPDHSIALGVPARVVKTREYDDTLKPIEQLEQLQQLLDSAQ